MKVTDERDTTNYRELGRIIAGEVVQFKHAFHQKNCHADDIFIVCEVVNCYRPHKAQYNGKIGIVNIRNGNLSYVESDRKVDVLPIECVIRDCCE